MRLKSLIFPNSLHLILISLWFQGCGLFSFSGAAFSSHINTFSVEPFYGNLPNAPTDISTKFTDSLKSKISAMTNLAPEEKDGDIQYGGAITDFADKTAFSTKFNDTGEEAKQVERLTIEIEVDYTNTSDETSSLKKKKFWASRDMLSTENKVEKEPVLIEEIFDEIVNKIASESIDNW